NALRARERPEVRPVRPVALTGEVDARELLVEADAHIGIGLVIPEADVEPRPVALDEALLGEQRLRFVLGHQELDRLGAVDQLGGPPEARSASGPLPGEVR